TCLYLPAIFLPAEAVVRLYAHPQIAAGEVVLQAYAGFRNKHLLCKILQTLRLILIDCVRCTYYVANFYGYLNNLLADVKSVLIPLASPCVPYRNGMIIKSH
ncbi:hypothetical protein, partial [Methanothrix sp.]|uniref:hypothetical protein n=1 Tax=Methanothrix sp. TaxID=90426 RepID=UPI002C41E496